MQGLCGGFTRQILRDKRALRVAILEDLLPMYIGGITLKCLHWPVRDLRSLQCLPARCFRPAAVTDGRWAVTSAGCWKNLKTTAILTAVEYVASVLSLQLAVRHQSPTWFVRAGCACAHMPASGCSNLSVEV